MVEDHQSSDKLEDSLEKKIGTFGKSGHFRTKKNDTSSGQIKILRPLL